MAYSKMKVFKLKALEEIGNIGAGHAATALAGMIHKKVMIDVCHVDLVDTKDMAEMLRPQQGDAWGVQSGFSGDINGSGCYLVSQEGPGDIVDWLKDCPHGGVVLSSYLRAVSSLLKFSVMITACHYIHRADFVSQLQSGPHTAQGRVFCTQTAFIGGTNRVKVCFYLILDNHSLEFIFQRV